MFRWALEFRNNSLAVIHQSSLTNKGFDQPKINLSYI